MLGQQDLRQNLVIVPQFEALLEQPIRREEDQHASGCHFCDLRDCLPQIENHGQRLSVLVAKVKALPVNAFLENTDQHLVRRYHVWVFQVFAEINLQFRLKRLKRCQSARCQNDRPRRQLLDLVKADACVEAQELQSSVFNNVARRRIIRRLLLHGLVLGRHRVNLLKQVEL